MSSLCTSTFAILLSFVTSVLGVSLDEIFGASNVARRSGNNLAKRNQAFILCEPEFGRHLKRRDCFLALSTLLGAGQPNPYLQQSWVPAHWPSTSSNASPRCGTMWVQGSVSPLPDLTAIDTLRCLPYTSSDTGTCSIAMNCVAPTSASFDELANLASNGIAKCLTPEERFTGSLSYFPTRNAISII